MVANTARLTSCLPIESYYPAAMAGVVTACLSVLYGFAGGIMFVAKAYNSNPIYDIDIRETKTIGDCLLAHGCVSFLGMVCIILALSKKNRFYLIPYLIIHTMRIVAFIIEFFVIYNMMYIDTWIRFSSAVWICLQMFLWIGIGKYYDELEDNPEPVYTYTSI